MGVRAGLAAFLLIAAAAEPQSSPPPEDRAERFRRMSERAEREGLAAPFKGVTADGKVVPGLFAVRSTGVSTEPVRIAAEGFISSLTPEQRTKTLFAVDDPEWRKWMNQHFYVRQGVGFAEMTAPQREAALGLLRASLSAKGLNLTRDIMRLNHTLGELNQDNFVEYGEWLYWITIMGTPSATEPWGWQLDGHHANVNYFVLGDQVVMTPTFLGSEPVAALSGKYKGVAVLQTEQDKGLALVRALDEGQRSKAIVRLSKTGNDNVGEAFKDNVVLDYAGIRASDLGEAQRRQLLDLVGEYVANMDDGHARVKMDEVRQHLDRTWFAWIGGTDADSVFYYRIHSPVILIEFDHQSPANLRRAARPDDPAGRAPNRQHIHTVVRTPNGNDYGKDLLRQHYERHAHGQTDNTAFDERARVFDYDPRVPLDIQERSVETVDGVEVHDLSYASPKGGRVPAYLLAAAGAPRRAGLLYMHWGQGNRSEFLAEGLAAARSGAVVLMIDAPYHRPEFTGPTGIGSPEAERALFVQLVVDLRRGVDLLAARPDVDPGRLGYVGHSLGATWGGALAGVDRRLRAAVLMGGLPSLTDPGRSYTDEVWAFFRKTYGDEKIRAYQAVVGPIDPEHFVSRAAPTRLLFQFARHDRFISDAGAKAYVASASDPKDVRWYFTGHELNDLASLRDRAEWLTAQLGTRPIWPELQRTSKQP